VEGHSPKEVHNPVEHNKSRSSSCYLSAQTCPRLPQGIFFSPVVTEIQVQKLFCFSTPEIPQDFHDPLVRSGPALAFYSIVRWK
jgi:hypothetical protein